VIRRRGRLERDVLGVALTADTVRAVLVKDGQVAWAHESLVGAERTMEDALRDVLAAAPGARRSRLPVAVAVGPARAQLRHVRNLPAVRDARTLTAIVQQSAGRYFRQNGIPMLTTPVAKLEPHAGWVGAIEATVVQAVVDACLLARHSTIVLTPTAAVLGHAAPDGHFTWRDGDLALELRYDDAEVGECRCTPARLVETANASEPTLAPALRALGPDALRYADAFAAARGGLSTPLALRRGRGEGEPSSGRLAMAAAASLVSLALLAGAPVVSAVRHERSAVKRVASLSVSASSAQAAQRQLADSARLLNELAQFQRAAPSVVLLLAALTRAIHAPSMLMSLRLDRDGGTLTALTPSAASLLAMLARVPEISGVAIVGSVTPENLAATPLAPGMSVPPTMPQTAPPARRLERLTVRFHWEGERRSSLATARAR
jgi:hypothetical protein